MLLSRSSPTIRWGLQRLRVSASSASQQRQLAFRPEPSPSTCWNVTSRSLSFKRTVANNGNDNDSDTSASASSSETSHHSKFMNPIVRQLWEQRQELKQTSASQSQSQSESSTKATFKNPSSSKTTIDYEFSSDEFLREAYRSPGGTMRFGKVLEDLDALAGNIAFQHVFGGVGDDNIMLVTAAVDRIALKNIPILEQDQRLSGQVTFVGSSSMEIRMQIHEVNANDDNDCDNDNNDKGNNKGKEEEEHWLEGYFTFVAVDPETNRPVKICPLVPETSEERALFELGSLKSKRKKELRRKLHVGTTGSTNQPSASDEIQEMDRRANQLMIDAFPLLHMPSLADRNAILLQSTKMQNCVIAQPQVRNLSNKIFGGFLMRRAFELAFANAYTFGGEWPQMLEVDNITFVSPVDVGDLLQFNSRVIYSLPEGGDLVFGEDGIGIGVGSGSEQQQQHQQPHVTPTSTSSSSTGGKPLIMIEVECYVMEPEVAKARLSNRFYFTFVLPTRETCRKVLPGTMEESKRMVERMVADEEQGLGKGYLLQYNL